MLVWLLMLCGVVDWPFYRGDAGASACAVAGVALPDTLTTLWEHRLEKGWFQASPIIVGKTVYIGSSDLGMHAFNLDDGTPRWLYPLESGVLAPATFGSGSVFFGDSDGVLHAVDAESGKARWTFATKGPIDNAPNVDAETGRVLVGSQDGTLHALDAATGKVAWRYETGDQIRCFPTIADRRCFVAGCDSRFHVVDLDTGRAAATVELDAQTGSTPAVLGDLAFFGTEGNEFLAVDWKQAKIAWRFEAKQAFRGPAACCPDGLVLFCGFDRTVHAHDAKTGEPRWTFRTKGRMETGPVIVGERVYVVSSDSFLYVLDRKTGRRLQAVEMPGKLLACPAVVDGRLVVGTDDGVLCCLAGTSNTAITPFFIRRITLCHAFQTATSIHAACAWNRWRAASSSR